MDIHIQIGDEKQITNCNFDAGGAICATNHLTVLELDNCPLITDASLDHLMHCASLERIELYDCQLITRAGIRRLKVGNPNLR